MARRRDVLLELRAAGESTSRRGRGPHDPARRGHHARRARRPRAGPVDPGAPMTCAFDLDHYRELIGAARAGGYRFAFFDGTPQPGELLLRHDVDLSLEAALAMAELEAELESPATYFLMTRSEFY